MQHSFLIILDTKADNKWNRGGGECCCFFGVTIGFCYHWCCCVCGQWSECNEGGSRQPNIWKPWHSKRSLEVAVTSVLSEPYSKFWFCKNNLCYVFCENRSVGVSIIIWGYLMGNLSFAIIWCSICKILHLMLFVIAVVRC